MGDEQAANRQVVHQKLDEVAARRPTTRISFPGLGESATVADLSVWSREVAAQLMALGIGRGDRVALVYHNEPDFLTALFSLSRCGAAASPIAVAKGNPETMLKNLLRVVKTAKFKAILISDKIMPLVRQWRDAIRPVELLVISELPKAPASSAALPEVLQTDDAVIQFTSGSTSTPKGVRLSHSNVLWGLDALKHRFGGDPEMDKLGTWLPFFHDMGVFSTLTFLLNGGDATVWSPFDFIKDPARWLKEFAGGKHTCCGLPSFAYDYLVDATRGLEASELDLQHWRVAVNGAEPISHSSIERFLGHFKPYGFRPEAMVPAYGLAEATLAVTFSPLGERPTTDWVDRVGLNECGKATPTASNSKNRRGVVCVGEPVRGMHVRVVNAHESSVCPDRHVGEVEIQGPSVTRGYLSEDPAISKRLAPGEWLPTGDAGYMVNGRLYVTGRLKEMLIVRGENYYPQDIENVVSENSLVYKRRCVAFLDTAGSSDQIVLVAESTSPGQLVADSLRAEIQQQVSLADLRVIVVSPRSIPRTTSGKLQRLETRRLYQTGELDILVSN
jgi:fatty-acyl-CoA synthase